MPTVQTGLFSRLIWPTIQQEPTGMNDFINTTFPLLSQLFSSVFGSSLDSLTFHIFSIQSTGLFSIDQVFL
jgi:hypothetical protein